MFLNLSNLKNFDWPLLIATVLLVCVGLTVIYSVTLSQAVPDYSLLQKQIIFFIIGLIVLFIFTLFDYRILGSLHGLIYAFSLFLLVGVLLFGLSIRGTRGWFQILGVGFQPVELAKLALIIFLAKFLSDKVEGQLFLKYLILSLLFVLVPMTLVMLQPDFGSSLVLILCWLGLIWLAGLNKKHFLIMILILLIIAALAWFWAMADYQKERVLNFLDPERDPLGWGYNVRQSIIAVGSGGFLGRGLGLGTQSQLQFLPETEADFIFASLAEELGFIGCLLVLGFYGLLFWRIYKIVRIARDNFSQLLTAGLAMLFFIHILINIGMVLGMLPVTGLSLPFISSGGSFLLVCLVAVGILESVAVRNRGVG